MARDFGSNIIDKPSDFQTLLKIQNPIPSSDGTATINGVDFTTKDNILLVNGVQLTLLKKTADTANPTNLSKISTQSDPTKAVDTLKAFVQSYNDLLDVFNKKIDEEKYRDFSPLSDDQKQNMKESEITAWEAKAKSGLLKNDDILKSTLSSMRSIISDQMGALSSIGISTGQYFEKGKLYIDEDKLKAALKLTPSKLLICFKAHQVQLESVYLVNYHQQ